MALKAFKLFSFPILLLMAVSCSTADFSSSLIEEDKLYVTRIFVGNFIDYIHTSPDIYGNPDLIWISTTRDSIHGKIAAFGKDCKFAPGERLYLRRIITTNGKNEAWVYQVENSSSIFYTINEYHNHRNVLVTTLFDTGIEERVPFSFTPPEKLAQGIEAETEVSPDIALK